MNWQHFKTLLWLRRRLFRNAMSAAGKINAIMTNILVVLGVLSSISLFALSLGLGIWLLPKASPDHILFLWTGIIVAFLFFWVIGVATELQRSEVLSIEKLLHYPISLSSAFLVNYLSSLVSAATIIFLPAMIGLCVASAISLGPSMLVTLLLLAGFVLMVTSITYQFRGWLATLMVNKRRRRTIVAFVTGGILILSQLPNLINLTFVRSRQKAAEAQSAEHNRKFQALKSDIDHHKIGAKEARTRLDALIQDTNGRKQADAQLLKEAKEWTARADLALPPGWLAYGAMEAAGGHIWPGLGGAVLMSTIAGLSLRRSYRTTLRFYTGGFQASSPPRQTADAPEHTSPSLETLAVPAVTAPATRRPVSNWVARSLPWMPDEVAATALATLRSLSRAPEVKMMMLSPFFLIVAFGSSRMLGKGTPIPPSLRAAMGLGIIVTVVVSLSQLTLNQFGYDRSAFRIFVL